MNKELIFDTLAYAKKLTAAGFTQQQAKVQAEALAEIFDEKMATKRDLRELEYRLKYDLTVRLGAMIATSIAITVSLIKLL